jgi:hypothetical protein
MPIRAITIAQRQWRVSQVDYRSRYRFCPVTVGKVISQRPASAGRTQRGGNDQVFRLGTHLGTAGKPWRIRYIQSINNSVPAGSPSTILKSVHTTRNPSGFQNGAGRPRAAASPLVCSNTHRPKKPLGNLNMFVNIGAPYGPGRSLAW